MENIRNIDDLIRAKNLTAEEMEMFKGMIDESREREKMVREYSQSTQENLKKLSTGLQTISDKVMVLGKALRNMTDEMDKLYLKLLPAEKFYRE